MSDSDPIFLSAPYKDRETVKALGACWSPEERRWWVPASADLSLFTPWLPARHQPSPAGTAIAPAAGRGIGALHSEERAVAPAEPKGMRLAMLLLQVSQAVNRAFPTAVWTQVDVVEARLRNGAVYLELSDRDATGNVLAKANAVIWANVAARILPGFERATGAKIGPGIKLLLKLKPGFKPQYGFSLEVEEIDAQYTLGDLEARKREIRQALTDEGVIDANKRLSPPWDFNRVLVIAPEGAAGLGDFRAEADRLHAHGVCEFVYAASRFQGEGAAQEIAQALERSLANWVGPRPDAVAIIRGGGAVNDLAWLNDLALARAVCLLPIPVLTGVGHERDSTVLDEVAHQRFDTPSKVILGIEQLIRRRTQEAAAHFALIVERSRTAAQSCRSACEAAAAATSTAARRQLAFASRTALANAQSVQADAVRTLREATRLADNAAQDVQRLSRAQASQARLQLPALAGQIRTAALLALSTAQADARAEMRAITARAGEQLRTARTLSSGVVRQVADGARQQIAVATTQSRALMLEIAGQGPDKTLGRGFSMTRDAQGGLVTGSTGLAPGAVLTVQWADGQATARVETVKAIQQEDVRHADLRHRPP